MKKLAIILLLVSISQLYAQYQLLPSVGFTKVAIGMNEELVLKELGEYAETRTFEEEKIAFEGSNYDTNKELIFNIGFDVVYIFPDKNPYGIWKAYFKKHKLVYFSISTYIFDQSVFNNITINTNLPFFSPATTMAEVLGSFDYKVLDESASTTYSYYGLGIELLFADNELRCAFVFHKLSTSNTKKMIKKQHN